MPKYYTTTDAVKKAVESAADDTFEIAMLEKINDGELESLFKKKALSLNLNWQISTHHEEMPSTPRLVKYKINP